MTADELKKYKARRGAEPAKPPPPDPRELCFTAERKRVNRFDDGDDVCVGCMFEQQPGRVCKMAGLVAVARGMPDCEAGFIYRPAKGEVKKIDPRQIDLFTERA